MRGLSNLTLDELPALAEEIARLRLTVAHLTTYGRAVLESVENGGLTVAHSGFPGYQARHALLALEDYVTRVSTGDWPALTDGQIHAAFNAHRVPGILRGDHLTWTGYQAAIADLLRPPATIHASPVLPVDGTVSGD